MAGTYSWVLTVSADDETCQDGGTVTVTEPCALDCSASVVPGYGGDPLAVAFEGAAIASNCGEQPSFSWAFGDGAGSQAQSPVHEYAAPGSYDWTLTVTADEADCTRSGTVTVTGPCDPQCAAEAVPDAGGAPLEVTFTAVVDTAGCTEAPAYAWSFGDGQASDQADPVHVYADPGLYAWTLTVEADGLTCSAEGAVEVLEPLKPGDCDGGGTITIGEVQGAVNMFLGTAAPACGVDCNGDGTVSIGEVQKVINGFLGFPATC